MTRPTIFLVPIEPLAERYTEQWYRRIPEFFGLLNYNTVTIDGIALENEVKVGTFLDINSTCHYKSTQLQKIASLFHQQLVPQGAVFFFYDLEFWGVEQVRLLADMNKVQIKIVGFMHAASYTKEDAFAIAAPYQQFTEVGWIAACDAVFVGSEYHRQAIIERRLKPLGMGNLADWIYNTGNPVFVDEYKKFRVKRRKKFVLTNRPDKEKRPIETLQLFAKLKGMYPDWEFVVTTGRSTFRGTDKKAIEYAHELQKQKVITIKAGLTKDEYHRELASAMFMVTHSIEENYGYCIAEAIHYGVIPLMRRGLSHDEFVAYGAGTKRLFSLGYTFTNRGKNKDISVARNWIEYVESEGDLEPHQLSLYTGALDKIEARIRSLLYTPEFTVSETTGSA